MGKKFFDGKQEISDESEKKESVEKNEKKEMKAKTYIENKAYPIDELIRHFRSVSKNNELSSESHVNFLKAELRRLDGNNFKNGVAVFINFQACYNNLYNNRR